MTLEEEEARLWQDWHRAREELRRVEEELRRLQQRKSPNFVEEIALDAHLVGKFLYELQGRTLTYRWQAKFNRRVDGSTFPSARKPTAIWFRGRGGLGAKNWMLHAWVLAQYGLAAGKGEDIHHKDGNIHNNQRENLQILSNHNHGRIAHEARTYALGFRAGTSGKKLSMDIARKIRTAHAEGRPNTSLAAEYGVSLNAIRRVVRNQSYREDSNDD